MVLTLISSLFGVLLGIISGLLPGIGSGSIMLLFFSVIILFDPLQILVLYLSLAISSQYVASVAAIYIGIPGAESASPTAKEFSNIRKFNLTNIAIIQNAKSALMGNIVGSLLFISLIPLVIYFLSIYKNDVKLTILSLTFLIILITSENKFLCALTIIGGFYLSKLGYNDNTFETFNLGLSFLNSGLPWISLTLGSLIGSTSSSLVNNNNNNNIANIESISNIRKEFGYKKSSLRGSFLGFFIGFVPGLSYILSSIVSYLIEKRILKNKVDNKELTLRPIAASESAHASGAIASICPFLVFGIPITASEAIILNVITESERLDSVFEKLMNNIELVLLMLLLVNVVSYFIAQQSKKLIQLFFSIPKNVIKSLLITFGFIAIYFSTYTDHYLSVIVYFITLIFFMYKNINPLPFIVIILLHNTIVGTFRLALELYS